MARPDWYIKLLKKLFPKRFFLARLTKIPGIKGIVDKMLFEDDDIYYLPLDSTVIEPKDKTIEIKKKIELPIDVVIPSQVIEHYIDQANYHWVMNFCICRSSEKCENYPIELGCLFLGEASINIDPKLGRKVTKEEAKQHVENCRKNGLVHLIGRNKLDTVWLDIGPGSKLLTICNCCECCCLWKMLPNLPKKISRKITKLSGVTVHINDNCVGCRTCSEGVCFVNAIKIKDGKAIIDQNLCRGCGRCISICQQKAIELNIEDPEYLEKTINRIADLVDVT